MKTKIHLMRDEEWSFKFKNNDILEPPSPVPKRNLFLNRKFFINKFYVTEKEQRQKIMLFKKKKI